MVVHCGEQMRWHSKCMIERERKPFFFLIMILAQGLRLDYQMHMFNPGGYWTNEFSADEQGKHY